MKNYTTACLLLALSAAHQAHADIITNGDFSDCSYAGWMKDTDGLGDISAGSDFGISAGPDCAAQLNVDGADTEAFFANTLFQDVTLSPGTGYSLSFELMVGSELTSTDSAFVADYFVIGFGDGTGNLLNADGNTGRLLEADIDGTQTYNVDVMLADTLASINDLTLEFQLLLGADAFDMTDLGASFMQIDNVAISQVNATDVNEPFSIALFGLGLAGMTLASRKRSGERSGL